MPKFSIRLRGFIFAIVAAFCLTPAAGRAQAPTAATRSTQEQAADDALLNKARTLYYSTAKAGLAGFDCTVNPDWLTTFVKANPGVTISSNDGRVVLLNQVAIVLHARLTNGNTSLDWTPPPGALTSEQNDLLNQKHSGVQQALTGFIQFWTPFVDGSVIPDSTSGMTVTHSPTSFTLVAEGGGTSITEVFSNDLLLEHYDLTSGGTSVKFEPSYKATPQGLLVEHFVASIQNPSAPVQQMNVAVQYQNIDGFSIPSRLDMEMAGTGAFNMTFSQCTVRR